MSQVRCKKRMTIFLLALLFSFVLIPSFVETNAFADEKLEQTKEIIAVQIRRQGFECKSPKSVKRDEKLSKPDLAVWELTCENARYRVHLVPDQAAKVEKLIL